jgi:heme exporter protein A
MLKTKSHPVELSVERPDASVASTGLAVIRANQLGKTIDDRRILNRLGFEVKTGEFVALLGANGAGKSTLLRVLATLTPPSHGELVLFGSSVGAEMHRIRGRLGLIGHTPMLYRDLTARENLIFFGRLYGVPDPSARADHMLHYVRLHTRANDAVKTFSRGMVQRVAIARALLHDPDLLLADEPFAGLDAPSTALLENMLRTLQSEGKTIVLANHDLRQSLELADRAIVLRKGRIIIDQPSTELDAAAVLSEVSV